MGNFSTYRTARPQVNTTDATVTTLGLFPTKSDKSYTVEAVIQGVQTTDFSEVAGYKVIGTFKNDGGTLSLVGSVTAVHTAESTASWAATLDASGTDIRVRVTGAAATAISWQGDINVYECGQWIANYGVTS